VLFPLVLLIIQPSDAIAPTVEWILKSFGSSPRWLNSYLSFSGSSIVFVFMILFFWVGMGASRVMKGLSWEDELALYENMAGYMQAVSEKIERWNKGHSEQPAAREYKESIGLALLDMGSESIIEKAQWIEIQRRNQVHRSGPGDCKD